ncbi:protein I'm not dead yet 2-like [Drosophila subobscura]|uniref:protein I'm not dead yet 2-like n=1 Tax=Drosophila subobscura TaxID=7241 RepID=UPI00155A0FFF|nr:protein I'm not dead yet 2-like [Drosophila subobscura]
MAEPIEPVPNEKISAGRGMGKCCRFHWRGKLTVVVPIILLPMLIHGYTSDLPEIVCLYLLVIMAIFWITEAIPLYLTSLFPIMFLPVANFLSSDDVTKHYFSGTVVMFYGGLVVALAIEYCNLHQRIALKTIILVGCSPRRLLCGCMLVSSFMSLWISNSAGTAMMCPIVKAVLNEMESEKIFDVFMTQEEEPMEEGEPAHLSKVAMSFYFGVAYSATVGGCGTLIGTGTNLVFKGIYENTFPSSKEEVSFPLFMAYTVPLVVIVNMICIYFSLLITHMALFRSGSKTGQALKKATDNKDQVEVVLRQRLKSMGPMSCHEIQVVIVFTLMIVLLFTRKPGVFTGWSSLIDAKPVGTSSTVCFCVILLFALPTQYTFFKYCCGKAPFPARTIDSLLSWDFLHRTCPWGLCFLLGGGFALAEACKVSGVTKYIANSMSFASKMPLVSVLLILLMFTLFCSAFTSNVVVANIVLPIYCELAFHMEVHPLLLTLPTCLITSLVFLLPVSTPPNAIICGYAHIKSKYLMRAGLLPTFWGLLLVFVNSISWGMVVIPEMKSFPDWAKEYKNKTRGHIIDKLTLYDT